MAIVPNNLNRLESASAQKVPCPVPVAGKTGTAEKLPRSENNYVLSFEGFAPVDNPQVMVFVSVDTVNSADQYHDLIAKQIFKDIMSQIMPYLNIQPSTPAQ